MDKVYSISTWTKIYYGIIAIGMFVFSIFLFNTPNRSGTPFVVILPLLMIIGSVLIIINIIKRKVIVTPDSIICINLFSRKEIAITNIKGCRINQKVIYIESHLSLDSTITIGNYIDLGDHKTLVKWLKDNFKDLDSIDLEIEHNKIVENAEYGLTEIDREESIKKAKKHAMIYNICGALLGFAAMFFNNKAADIFLLLYPILGILVILTSKGLIKFLSDSKKSVYSFIMIGFALPSFITLIKSLNNYNIFQPNQLWIPILIVSGIVFILLFTLGLNKSLAIKGQVFLIIIISLLYGGGSIRAANCLFDNCRPKIYKAIVLAQRVSHGKSTSYFFTLGEWGPRQKEEDVEVRKYLYENTSVGDTVQINFKQGIFNIPWFVVTNN